MTEGPPRFEGSVPDLYDSCLGPMKFEPYAQELAARFTPAAADAALEIACGTGRVTRHLLRRLPPGGRLVATDLFGAMIEKARTRVPDDPRLEWKVADACALPFADARFQWVVCQFGVMFVPDKPLAMREAARVLTPGGRFLFNVWDELERNEITWLAHRTINQFFPDDPVGFYAEVPFGLHRTADLKSWLSDAGFTGIEIVAVELQSRNASAREAAQGLVLGTPVSGAIRERGTVPIEEIVTAVEQAIASAKGPGEILGRMRAWVASASKP